MEIPLFYLKKTPRRLLNEPIQPLDGLVDGGWMMADKNKILVELKDFNKQIAEALKYLDLKWKIKTQNKSSKK